MTATGRIGEDLPVIKEIIDRIGSPYVHRDPWWGKPCSEESIRALADEYGELPQDVIDFYRVTNIATFGRFDEILDPTVVIRLRERLSEPFSEAEQRDYPFLFEHGLPKGEAILPMSGSRDWGCLIELGGPDHGRVINPFDESYFRTLAWSLSDAVACIRELYEFGWYEWNLVFGRRQDVDLVAEVAKVQPILDKWNCNPVICNVADMYGYEPERPTKQEM